MISHLRIRTKLLIGIALLMCTVGALAGTSFVGLYAFRGLAKTFRLRAPELTHSSSLAGSVSRLTVAYELYEKSHAGQGFQYWDLDTKLLQQQFQVELDVVAQTFRGYRELLDQNKAAEASTGIGVMDAEQAVVEQFQETLNRVQLHSEDWQGDELAAALVHLNLLAENLPIHLHKRLGSFADDVRGQYRMWMILSGTMAVISAVLLIALCRLFYVWILHPMRVLIHGSRLVAAGHFDHRIRLDSHDEIAELANAMNNMTNRFQQIRDDLDQQVKQRTKEVVRGEQLASVGFLAAGVAHEINNPLASIALCAESLETRLLEVVPESDDDQSSELQVIREYLRMMQDEAFRCKEITEQLLDFSRLGDVEKQQTNLTELVHSVVEMLRHLGKYKEKTISIDSHETIYALANAQEMKQVVLNLLTNALDSLDPGGTVRVMLNLQQNRARLVVSDDGCGMTTEVQEHLFEPFYTRRRDGQGTGLGMSITYRIVHEHGGQIDVHSDGPGHGSTIQVTIPQAEHDQNEKHHGQRGHAA